MAWTPLPETVEVTVDTPKPKAFTLDPARTVVLVVDMQNNFCKKGNQRAFDVIEGNERLLAKARDAGATVIYSHSLRQVESPEHTVFGRPIHLIVGTWDAEIIDEIAPQPTDHVIQKWSHDIWAWPGLETLLQRRGLLGGDTTVLVTGVSAAFCVHAASLGLSNRDYHTVVALDCGAASEEMEARIYHQYLSDAYRHNIDFTLSTMVSFETQPA